MKNENTKILSNIEDTMEMNLLQNKKVSESVDNLEPIMEGILVKTDELVKEAKKSNPIEIEINGAETIYYKGEKGEPGDKPSKEELVEIIKPLIPEPKDGKDGVSVDKNEIIKDILQIVIPEIPSVEEIVSQIPIPKDGKDGMDADEVDIDLVVEKVVNKIPKAKNGKDGSPDTPKQVKSKLLEEGLSYDELKDAPNIEQLTKVLSKTASKTTSLIELDDVDLSGVTQTNGKYVLGGGSGAVSSVNGQTGVVVLDADDIDDTSTTQKFVTSSDLTKLSNLSGTNTGDQTSIVGITGTKAQFDTAVSDGNIMFDGDSITNATATAHRVFYSDGSGVINELALGADGTFLKSNGASVAPSFATPAGSGDVSKVGTPVNNQVGVWTGDGTIEGDVDLTFDTTTNTLGVGLVALDGRVQTHAVKSDASDGLLIEASDGTDVGLMGVANTANATWYGSHNYSTATQDTIAAFTGAGKTLGSLATATYPSLTELSYVKGVSSAIQTQLGTKQATITFGTGVQTALGVNVGSAGAPVLFNGALGTPSSGTLTNATGLPVSGITASTVTALGVGSIELGHASDTSITRVSAGRIAVEGVNVVTISSTDTLTNKTLTSPTLTTPVLGTPSSGTLTNCTGLPVAGITSSTTQALGVGSIELGHASDTTLSRSSAGVLAVEGVVVPTISSTSTLTNKRITKRTGTTTSSATPTINTDDVDFYSITAQTVDITSFTTNLSGTPTEGQTLWIAITGTAARAITWGSSFEASTVALPTTTVTTARLDVGFVWNTSTSKWRCVASA